jgi:hypothetical protein
VKKYQYLIQPSVTDLQGNAYLISFDFFYQSQSRLENIGVDAARPMAAAYFLGLQIVFVEEGLENALSQESMASFALESIRLYM